MTSPRPRARSRLQRHPADRQPIRHTPSKSYLKFLPLLLLASPFYTGVYWLVTTIRPDQIQNWLLPNSFIPFHLLLFFGNFFLFTFLTLKKRWGIFIALAIQWLLFLKLQEITLDLWAWGSAFVLGAGGFWLRTVWKSRK